jgi:signal transduction histidine kinase
MGALRRNRWFVAAGAGTLAFATVSAALPKGRALTAIADVTYFGLVLLVGLTMFWNARRSAGTERRFWVLLGFGYLTWSVNSAGWVHYEVLHAGSFPDPSFLDLFLFLHLIPMIAAVGLRPHRKAEEEKFRVGTVDFLLLMVWWVFLYAFVVFPSQYVNLNVPRYDRNFGILYFVQSAVLVGVLGIAGRGARGGWKRVYVHLMCANAIYAIASQALNVAISHGTYYTGGFYDVPLVGTVAWMAATAASSRDWQMKEAPPRRARDWWGSISVRLSMLAILSLPMLGLWGFFADDSPAATKTFRLFTVLAAMLALGMFMFLRQYLQDQTLMRLLEESRASLETERRLQNHLVQREKLASLGQMVAGAAQEIDHPLTAIMDLAEKLWSSDRLNGEQDTMLRKLAHHSHRTRERIASLLSFAQQSSGEKKLLDVCILLQRSVHMRELQRHDQKIRIETLLEPSLPKIWGDGHQLFQAFVQIAENGLDALQDAGGGLLRVSARAEGDEVVVRFSDSGPGVKEPHRVFDPFYTTKPVGKGTGLGLSAVYGVVQDHKGEITCENNPEGGASFTLRLPIARGGQQALAAAKA